MRMGHRVKNGRIIMEAPQAGQGIELIDELGNVKIHIGKQADGSYAGKFIGSKLYSSLFQTGLETDDTYIALDPAGILTAFYGGKQNIGMWASQNWGNMIYYYDGNQVGQLYTASETDNVIGGTQNRFHVWSKSGGSLCLSGPGIELQSDNVFLAGSTSAQVSMRGRIKDSLLPVLDLSGYVGNDTYRWNTVRAFNIDPGDLNFSERTCAICEQPFVGGDALVLLAKTVHEEHHTMTIPIHDRCKGVAKSITMEVPETEERFRLKADGQMEKYHVSKFIEAEEQTHRVKEGYDLDEKTGEFKKKALVVKVAKEGYSARLTPKTVKIFDQYGQLIKEFTKPQTLKFYDDQAGHEVELSAIQEPVEIFPEQPATKDEAVESVPVKRRQPVMKTITVEIGQAGL